MSKFQAIVPSTFETMATGFIGAGERTAYGKVWRVELHKGKPPRVLKDGVEQDLQKCRGDITPCLLVRDCRQFFSYAIK